MNTKWEAECVRKSLALDVMLILGGLMRARPQMLNNDTTSWHMQPWRLAISRAEMHKFGLE